jgi:hypothetical protein
MQQQTKPNQPQAHYITLHHTTHRATQIAFSRLALDELDNVNTIAIIILVMEGLVLCGLVIMVMSFLLKQVRVWRVWGGGYRVQGEGCAASSSCTRHFLLKVMVCRVWGGG